MNSHKRKINSFKIITEPIKAKTFTGMYGMHKYWTKKPYNVVNQFIDNYSMKGEVILDPFAGCGVVVSESLILGRKVISIDINPIANFISKMRIMPLDIELFKKEYFKLKEKVLPKINSLYLSECSACEQMGVISHSLFENGEIKKIKLDCLEHKKIWKKPTKTDMTKSKYYEEIEPDFWYPNNRLIQNSRVNISENMTIKNLFSGRNLHAITILYDEILKIENENIKNMMKFNLTSSLPQMSKLVFVIKRRNKMKNNVNKVKEEVGSWVAGFWMPKEHWEINVWRCFDNRYKKILRGKKQSNQRIPDYKEADNISQVFKNKDVYISTSSATDFFEIPNNSIGYVFTDPPHGDRVPYLELSMIWSSWLNFEPNFEQEIVISNSPLRNKDFGNYKDMIETAFAEIYRVLQPDRFMTVAFHNRDKKVWDAFLSACWKSGFKFINYLPIKASAGSVVQDSRPGALKGELIITFQKTNLEYKKSIIDNTKKVLHEKGHYSMDYNYVRACSYLMHSGLTFDEALIFMRIIGYNL